MAVDYLHRVMAEGPRQSVVDLRRRLTRTTERRVQRRRWSETCAFSFAAVYEIAKMRGEAPFDPYNLSDWPVRAIRPGLAEIRYQFHTRNLELAPLISRLSEALPLLTFRVVTLCYDDSCIEAFRFRAGAEDRRVVSDRRMRIQLGRVGRKNGVSLEDAGEDDFLFQVAEQQVLDAACRYWEPRGRKINRKWFGPPKRRRLEDEQALAVASLNPDAVFRDSAQRKPKKRR